MTFTSLMAVAALATPGEPICHGPLDLRVLEVPITTYSGGVMLTTNTTSWTVVPPDQRAVDTVSLARALDDVREKLEIYDDACRP